MVMFYYFIKDRCKVVQVLFLKFNFKGRLLICKISLGIIKVNSPLRFFLRPIISVNDTQPN